MRITPLTLSGGFGQTLCPLHLSWFALLIRLLAMLVFWWILVRFLEIFLSESGDWLPTLDEISLPRLTGEMLFDAVHAKSLLPR